MATTASAVKKARPTTMNRGADDERAAVLGILRRQLAKVKKNPYISARDIVEEAITKIKGRAARTAEKKGGLGRK